MTLSLTRHPASIAWGDMTEVEFDALLTSVRMRGCDSDIIVQGDLVLDGWHRYRACNQAGIEPRIREVDWGPGKIASFVNSEHCARRNLSAHDRAERVVATKVACGLQPAPPGNPELQSSQDGTLEVSDTYYTLDDIADEAGVSRSTAQRAIKSLTTSATDKAIKDAEKAGASAKARKGDTLKDELDTQKHMTEITQGELREAEATIVSLRATLGEADVDDATAEWKRLAEERGETIRTLRAALVDANEKVTQAAAETADWKARYMKLEEKVIEGDV